MSRVLSSSPTLQTCGLRIRDVSPGPLVAIDGGDNGLDVARGCLWIVDIHLGVDGSAIVQLGTTQEMDDLANWARARGKIHASEHRAFDANGVLVRFDRSAQGLFRSPQADSRPYRARRA